MIPPTSWFYVTCGALFGGLAIRYIGFRDGKTKGLKKFLTTCIWLQKGIVVTTVSTCFLRLTRISIFFENHTALALLLQVIGYIKFYPITTPNNYAPQTNNYFFNYIQWTIFWLVPSISFCTFDYETLEKAAWYSLIIYTTCFTAGTIVPLRDFVIEDFGIRVAESSVVVFIIGLTLRSISQSYAEIFSPTVLINSCLATVVSGLLIDDLQHIKLQFEEDNETTENNERIEQDTIRKSIPLFLESTFIFGRIATIIAKLNEPSTIS